MYNVKVPKAGTACAKVWEIASMMKGARRRHVLDACVAADINPYTAATQYQAWKTHEAKSRESGDDATKQS